MASDQISHILKFSVLVRSRAEHQHDDDGNKTVKQLLAPEIRALKEKGTHKDEKEEGRKKLLLLGPSGRPTKPRAPALLSPVFLNNYHHLCKPPPFLSLPLLVTCHSLTSFTRLGSLTSVQRVLL
ncbi:hypothetical protein CCACVL1_10536 [Corchorus capsularis]|uniref:Uncharacterized protein n=1 Tax=Corchorus capsularis TaxID=210143 RepID=A0A1R3IQV7_COCAP|nr:hypothetical protein CCACVL1_10536 [Corchorus capsularis]